MASDQRRPEPVLPDYGGGCITNVVAAISGDVTGPWVPGPLGDASTVVLLVLDGLGWEQLSDRAALAPTMTAMDGGPITTVAPTTTSTALTSLATGLPPGEHGVVGYRVAVDGDVLNVLRWTTPQGDARDRIVPGTFQTNAPFGGERSPVVTRAEFAGSGFTQAHLDGVRFHGYRTMGALVAEVDGLVRAGEPFVYCYYDGLDKVSHEFGLGPHFDRELSFVDHLVAELLACLPPGGVLAITSDHGQVHVGESKIAIDGQVRGHVAMQSGEGRFRWLHARAGRRSALVEAARESHGDVAWVRTVDEIIDEGWFGPKVSDSARSRLGDVALVPFGATAFEDPADTGPYHLVGRHGSLTSAEMLVPFLAASR